MDERMSDRFTSRWPAKHIIWLEAAMTLDKADRAAAHRDIAAMTGRSLKAVRQKHQQMRENVQAEMEWATAAHQRPLPIALGPAPTPFKWPSRAALCGGTGRLGKSPIAGPPKQG
jgi:hypothetical protein